MRRRFYTPREVAAHNTPEDCWLSIFNAVVDVTDLVKARAAGLKWRDGVHAIGLSRSGGEVAARKLRARRYALVRRRDAGCEEGGRSSLGLARTVVSTGMSTLRAVRSAKVNASQGLFVHVAPPFPCSDYDFSFRRAWWDDPRYQVGKLTRCVRIVRFKNMLTGQEDRLEVPEEETVGEIRRRYAAINPHASAYALSSLVKGDDGTWSCRQLRLSQSLEENGIVNESPLFAELDVTEDFYVPVIFTRFLDDLSRG